MLLISVYYQKDKENIQNYIYQGLSSNVLIEIIQFLFPEWKETNIYINDIIYYSYHYLFLFYIQLKQKKKLTLTPIETRLQIIVNKKFKICKISCNHEFYNMLYNIKKIIN